jgi:hypothetical protein
LRLTTSTAATAAVAGLAALVTGCSSSSSGASAPVVPHHAVQAQPAAAAAAPASPRAALSAAIRATLAAHTVQFRYRNTVSLVDPTKGENINPYAVGAGIANFDSNLATMNVVDGQHAEQPFDPDVTELILGASKFAANTDDAVAGKKWTKAASDAGDSADVLVTQVLQDVKGPITVVRKTQYSTEYRMQSDLHQLILDQGGSSSDAASFSGSTQTETVWVNSDGLIARVRWAVSPSQVAGLSASEVRAVYVTLDFENYGVDMFVPSHPTA